MKKSIGESNQWIELLGLAFWFWIFRFVWIWTLIAIFVFCAITLYWNLLETSAVVTISIVVFIGSYVACILWGIYRAQLSDVDPIDDNDEE
jgi:hypothetical protein